MQRYTPEILDPKQVAALSRKELLHNEYICETAGFEPLAVRLKRFEQQGILRQVQRQDITSADLREMYLNPDYQLSPDDDPEEILEKMKILQKHIADVKEQARKRNLKLAETTASASSQAVSAAEKTEDDLPEE